MTILDKKHKAISEKLLQLVGAEYDVDTPMDIIRKPQDPGKNVKYYTESRRVFFYLLKKHTTMTYRDIWLKLGTVSAPDAIHKYVLRAESDIKYNRNVEFTYQLKLIEREIIQFSQQWLDSLEPIN